MAAELLSVLAILGSTLSAAIRNDSGAIENADVENMDSVCIDCHGDRDRSAIYTAETSSGVLGTYGTGRRGGCDLLRFGRGPAWQGSGPPRRKRSRG